MQRVDELMQFVREQGDKPAEFDDSLVRKLIEKVVVCGERFQIVFK